MTKYIAFLRGINSGSNPTIKMDVLRNTFEGLGFQNVHTVIASGNVLFDADSAGESELEQKIEAALPKAIGFQSAAIVYKLNDLQKLMEQHPFSGIENSPKTRPYITYLKNAKTGKPSLNGKGFQILGASGRALFSVVDLSSGSTPDLMRLLDKEYGKGNTTRSLKTMEKVLAKAAAEN